MAIYRDRPGPQIDNQLGGPPSRSGRYSEAYVNPITGKEMFAGDEGSFFMAITPTPGTGIIGHAAPTTFDETKPYLHVYNGSSFRLYPQFLRLHDTVVSVGGARVQFTVVVDNVNRYSSGGTALTINNVNMDSTNSASNVSAFVGAVTATAASASRRVLDHIVFRGTIDVVEDVYSITFGSGDGQMPGSSRAATVEDAGRVTAPVVIGPGHSLLIHQWAAAQSTGPTFQVALGFILR